MKFLLKIFLINLFVLIIALSLIEFFIIGSKSYDNRFISFREYPPELNLNGNKLTDVKGYLGNLQDYNGIIYGSSPIANFDLKLEDKYKCKIFLIDPTQRAIKHYEEVKELKLTTAMLQQYFFGNIKTNNIMDSIDELKEICNNNDYEYKKDTLYT